MGIVSDNPLAGLRIPSVKDMADQIVNRMGIGTVDFAQPLQRQRFRDYIEQAIGMELNMEFERALSAATQRAVEHVFRIMRDADYQEKRRAHRERAAKVRAEKQAKRKQAEQEARMNYSKRHLVVSKATVQ